MRHIALLVVLSLQLLVGRAGAQDWPQFRGPDGRAEVVGFQLPTDFGAESSERVWRTPVRGVGISSPIVTDGKVFVTAAYQGEERSRIRGRTVGATLALAALALVAIVLRRKSTAVAGDEARAAWRIWSTRLDFVVVVLATLGFIAGAWVAVFEPARLWTAGLPGDAWLVTGTIGLLGLFAGFGSFAPRSLLRLIGVVALLAAAWYALTYLPLNKHRSVFKPLYRAVLVAPGIGGALWFMVSFLAAGRGGKSRLGVGNALGLVALASLSAVVFVTTNVLNPQVGLVRALLCFDLETGDEVWDAPLFVAGEERIHRDNSFATPTPCTNGESVFAFFGGGYACVDLDGNVLWEGRDDTYLENARYGCVSSPIPFEDTYIVGVEGEQELRPSYLMALDAKTGDVRWRIEPEGAHDSYMTPLLMPVGGSVQLILASLASVVSYDPRTGEELWRQSVKIWQHAPSLTYAGDLLLVAGGAHLKFATMAIRLSGEGKETEHEILWQTNKSVPDSPSPVHHEGIFFTVNSNGILIAYDPETGRKHWKERLGGQCLSSLIGAGGQILACMEAGEVVVIDAAEEFEVVSQTTLDETIKATPALAGGRLLLRTDKALYCFQAGASEASADR